MISTASSQFEVCHDSRREQIRIVYSKSLKLRKQIRLRRQCSVLDSECIINASLSVYANFMTVDELFKEWKLCHSALGKQQSTTLRYDARTIRSFQGKELLNYKDSTSSCVRKNENA